MTPLEPPDGILVSSEGLPTPEPLSEPYKRLLRVWLRYDRERHRVWVLKARLHHGMVGLILIVVGAWMVWDDRHDAPWLRDPP